jgi:formylglycine-generating enzyme required for sulfatase activity
MRADDANCDGVEDVITASGLDLLAVPAGTFEMGCTAGQSGCQTDESPAHTVTLSQGFWMGETEVTQGQWLAVMGTSPSALTSCGAGCPVESVSWYDALSFANSVSASESLAPCYDLSACTGTVGSTFACSAVGVNSPTSSVYGCEGYRLPTEAEWEYGARAGNDLLYAGSNDADDVAWYSSNSSSTSHEVAQKDSNNWGLYDMSGNVWEWVWDGAAAYGAAPVVDPVAAPSTTRVLRGASWDNTADAVRVSYRFDEPNADSRYDRLGFRIVRTVPRVDADNDGAFFPEDCDDDDPAIYPHAPDTYGDNVDSDCDGIDCESANDGSTNFLICPAQSRDAGAATCSGAGYRLASVRSSQENDFIQTLLLGSSLSSMTNCSDACDRAWVSYEDPGNGNWAWSDVYSGGIGFTNWFSGEPTGAGRRCTLLDAMPTPGRAGKWLGGTYCGDVQPVVCESRLQGVGCGGQTMSLVPILSSNTSAQSSHSIVVSASTELNPGTAFPPSKAFNGTNSYHQDCWHSALRGSNSASHPEWLRADFGAGNAVVLSEAILTSRNHFQHRFPPTTYQIQGSNNGSSWTTLVGVVNDNSITGQDQTTSHSVSNAAAYRYLRVNIDATSGLGDNNDSYAALGKLEFIGCHD